MKVQVVLNEQHNLLSEQQDLLDSRFGEGQWEIFLVSAKGWNKKEVHEIANELIETDKPIVFASPVPLLVAMKSQFLYSLIQTGIKKNSLKVKYKAKGYVLGNMWVGLKENPSFRIEVRMKFTEGDLRILAAYEPAGITLYDLPEPMQKEMFNRTEVVYRNPISYSWNKDIDLAFNGWFEQSEMANRLWDKLRLKIKDNFKAIEEALHIPTRELLL